MILAKIILEFKFLQLAELHKSVKQQIVVLDRSLIVNIGFLSLIPVAKLFYKSRILHSQLQKLVLGITHIIVIYDYPFYPLDL